jgi:hypothetical protein
VFGQKVFFLLLTAFDSILIARAPSKGDGQTMKNKQTISKITGPIDSSQAIFPVILLKEPGLLTKYPVRYSFSFTTPFTYYTFLSLVHGQLSWSRRPSTHV